MRDDDQDLDPVADSSGRPPETALWLCPREADRRRLAALIGELARRFAAPPFAPHVTVFGGVTTPLPRLDRLLQSCAAELPPLSLAAAGLAHGPAFFQCVFLEIAEASPVTALRRRLSTALGKRPEEEAHPHLSLLYAELEPALREKLCRELGPTSAGPVRCDALEVIAPRRDHAADWRDVAGWRRLRRYPLSG